MFSLDICDFDINICGFNTIVTCNSYKNVRLYLLQMGEWTWTEYHSYYCLFQFSENGDTKTVCFSRFCLQCDVFLRNFALGKWFTITVSHIWCEMFSTSIWHSLFPSCESYGQICTWKSETGTVSVRRAPDKNDKPYFLRASPTDKFALENQRRVFQEPLSLLSAHVRTRRL